MPPSSPVHPAVTFAVLAVDAVLFRFAEERLEALVIPIHSEPYFSQSKGFPGGLIKPTETAEQAVERIIMEKTGLSSTKSLWLQQLMTFSRIDRDPKGRVVSTAYLGIVPPQVAEKIDSSYQVHWTPIKACKKLAYDHDEMVTIGFERLQSKLLYTPIVRWLLPTEFTLTDFQTCYEQLLQMTFDRRNFRKRLLGLDLIEETGEQKKGGAFRPAALYRFKKTLPKIIQIVSE